MSVAAPINIMMMKAAPKSEMMAAAFMQAAFNIANAMGAFLGGIPLEHGLSYNYPSLVGVGMTVIGLIISIVYFYLYRSSDEDEKEIAWLQEKFVEIGDLYIADGHHRSASAELLYEEDKASENENLNYFMSFLIAESNVKIYEYNRIIRDLNGYSKEEFLNKLSESFWLKNKEQELWKPTKKFEFGMYLDGEFYSLTLKDEHSFTSVLESLDAQILYEKVLNPILGIEDLRNDERIDYIPGKQSISVIKDLIDEGEFEVGFMLFPTSISAMP